MPTPKKTATVHRLAGTFRNDRHETKPAAVVPIDPAPPAHLDAASRTAWAEIVRDAADYMAQSDRHAVELASVLVAKVRGGGASAADVAQLVALLGRLGCTPAGRRGLEPVKKQAGERNPFDELDS